MIVNMYAIKDTKSSFWKPHTQVNDAVAIREFSNMINSGANDFCCINYADLELYRIGTYDDANGATTSEVVFICSGTDVKKVGE